MGTLISEVINERRSHTNRNTCDKMHILRNLKVFREDVFRSQNVDHRYIRIELSTFDGSFF